MTSIRHLENLIADYPHLLGCKESILKAYEYIHKTYKQRGKLLVCGNGGSAADAEHIVGELMKEFAIKRPLSNSLQKLFEERYEEDGRVLATHLQGALPAITLTSNISLSTAYSNDAVPELVFAQQVYGYGKKEDILIGISTSGNSKNVIYALEVAKVLGMRTIGLTGETGGKMRELCDVCICVPSTITPKIQEMHLPIYHALCMMIEEEFFG